MPGKGVGALQIFRSFEPRAFYYLCVVRSTHREWLLYCDASPERAIQSGRYLIKPSLDRRPPPAYELLAVGLEARALTPKSRLGMAPHEPHMFRARSVGIKSFCEATLNHNPDSKANRPACALQQTSPTARRGSLQHNRLMRLHFVLSQQWRPRPKELGFGVEGAFVKLSSGLGQQRLLRPEFCRCSNPWPPPLPPPPPSPDNTHAAR